MSPVPDEGSVQQLVTASPDPALSDRVHAGRPDVTEHGPDAGVGEDRAGRGGEVRSAVAVMNLTRCEPVAELEKPAIRVDSAETWHGHFGWTEGIEAHAQALLAPV